MAKETKPAAKHAHAPAKSKSSAKTWLIAAVAVIVIILLIVWGRKAGEAQAPAGPAQETAPAAEPQPTEEAPATPRVSNTAPDRELPPLGPSGDAEVVSRSITWKTAGGQPVTKEDDNSMFSDVSCQHAEGGNDADKTTLKEDAISFTFTNNGKKSYHLYYVKYGSEGFNDAVRISVNGGRVRDAERACGKENVAPGETITCTGAQALLRTGQTYTGKSQVNILQAQSAEFVDVLVFKC